MARREGTSKSNSVDATGSSQQRQDRTQNQDSHRKINIARDSTSRFGWEQVKPIQLFMAKPTVTTRGHGKFVSIKKIQAPRSGVDGMIRMSAPVDASDDEISWKSAISKPLRALKNAKSLCLRNMTRREGTSKSNSVDATGSSQQRKTRTQISGSHRKMNIASDPTSRFG